MPFLLRRYGTLIGFLALIVFFWAELPDTFLTARNLLNITQQMSMLAVVSATMTVVMAMGDFDLSVGSIASLAGIVAAHVFVAGGPPWLAVPAALAVGLGGRRRQRLPRRLCRHPAVHRDARRADRLQRPRLSPLRRQDDLRLGHSGLLRRLRARRRRNRPDRVRDSQPDPRRASALLLVWLLLEQTIFGRRLYAIGGNAEAARLAGVRIKPLKLAAFGLSGFGAAAAGLMIASRVASANPTQGAGLMLDAIAAVFLGMTMSEEGEPRVLYTLLGVLMLGVLGNGLTQMNVDSYVRDMITGLIIIVAVAASSLGRARQG